VKSQYASRSQSYTPNVIEQAFAERIIAAVLKMQIAEISEELIDFADPLCFTRSESVYITEKIPL
jgi:hypothetical protein